MIKSWFFSKCFNIKLYLITKNETGIIGSFKFKKKKKEKKKTKIKKRSLRASN